jgi:hypothetical protein
LAAVRQALSCRAWLGPSRHLRNPPHKWRILKSSPTQTFQSDTQHTQSCQLSLRLCQARSGCMSESQPQTPDRQSSRCSSHHHRRYACQQHMLRMLLPEYSFHLSLTHGLSTCQLRMKYMVLKARSPDQHAPARSQCRLTPH